MLCIDKTVFLSRPRRFGKSIEEALWQIEEKKLGVVFGEKERNVVEWKSLCP
jgi:hypothetical protein